MLRNFKIDGVFLLPDAFSSCLAFDPTFSMVSHSPAANFSVYSRSCRRPHDLPVASILSEVVAASRGGAVVVTAPPGSGKTMLVPAAVLDDLDAAQKLVLLQPRRLAARAVARRIAHFRGSRVGEEVGYHVRFDAQVTRDTRLIVATTGILLRRMLSDISLDGIGAVVLDEFHERTIEMDLLLGLLVRIKQTLRPDMRIVVMSATLAAEPVAKLLGGCPIIHAEGRRFPVQIRYQRRGDKAYLEDRIAAQLPHALADTTGTSSFSCPASAKSCAAKTYSARSPPAAVTR